MLWSAQHCSRFKYVHTTGVSISEGTQCKAPLKFLCRLLHNSAVLYSALHFEVFHYMHTTGVSFSEGTQCNAPLQVQCRAVHDGAVPCYAIHFNVFQYVPNTWVYFSTKGFLWKLSEILELVHCYTVVYNASGASHQSFFFRRNTMQCTTASSMQASAVPYCAIHFSIFHTFLFYTVKEILYPSLHGMAGLCCALQSQAM